MRIRHTVIFTFYETTTNDQIEDVIGRLHEMGDYLTHHLGVSEWVVAKHIHETFREGRASLLQDCIFPSLEALQKHGTSDAHKHVIEVTPNVCDWMTIDTLIPES